MLRISLRETSFSRSTEVAVIKIVKVIVVKNRKKEMCNVNEKIKTNCRYKLKF